MTTEDQPTTKRRRRDAGRVRVTRACDFCKRKKLKCTGTVPCALCAQAKRDCTYVSDYNRGKLSSGSTKSKRVNASQEADSTIAVSLGISSPQEGSSALPMEGDVSCDGAPTAGDPLNQDFQDQLDPSNSLGYITSNIRIHGSRLQIEARDVERSSRNSPEPSHIDQEGHYVGPASGVSFLSRALKKLRQTHRSTSISLQHSSIFNFADRPMPDYDPYFLILPAKADAQALIRSYFGFASPTHRYLHQPTVERWCDEFYYSVNAPKPLPPGGHEKRAIILGVMAVAKQYTSSQDNNAHETVNSTAFFAASEHHLQLESGGIRLTSIQARLLQCFHLLSQSRVNSAWSLFGTVANLVLTIGLHRRYKRDANFEIDLIERECRKRVFWSAYTLDSYLGIGLGRPRSFHDEDLDQDLPLCVDDWQITPTKILPCMDTEQCLTRASIFHAKLLKIISGILRDLYGLKRPSHGKQEEVTQLYDDALIQWRDDISDFLDITKTEMLTPIFRRQHTVLLLAYSQAIILLHRQALLTRPYTPMNRQTSALRPTSQYSVNRCLTAATAIVTKLRQLIEKQQMYSAFWFTHYYVFSALVALYLFVIQSRSKPTRDWKQYLDLAQQGLRDLESCSTDMSYAQRYVVVLTELQYEAMKSVDEEVPGGQAGNGVEPLDESIITAAANVPSTVDLGLQAITPVTGSHTVSSQEFAAMVPGFDGQDDTYNEEGEAWALQDLENQEAFRDLNIEGLADLAFIFSAESINVPQTEGVIY